MQIVHLSSAKRGGVFGPSGFGLVVEEVPWWVLGVGHAYDFLIRVADHPCCYTRLCSRDCGYRTGFECDERHRRTTAGFVLDHLPGGWQRGHFEVAQFWLLNNRLAMLAARRVKRIVSVAITVEEAMKFDPKWVQAQESVHDEIDQEESHE